MPTAKGAQALSRMAARVTDGAFTKVKKVIAGFWFWNCASLHEAIEWVSRCPIAHGQDRFEIRQLYELEDLATEGEGYEQHRRVDAALAARR